jgi:hypothetical protein
MVPTTINQQPAKREGDFMKPETLERDKKDPLYKRALPFIEKLLGLGIPLSAIDTNDFNSSKPRVYVTREYGRDFGGRYKKYSMWNDRTAKYALEFYNAKTPTSFHGSMA